MLTLDMLSQGMQVAAWIRTTVQEQTKLTCSVGIAANMMVAKICSDMRKPNGQFEVARTRDAIMAFVADLPIRKIPGIGKVLAGSGSGYMAATQ
jgi:DNA polymerase kappa